MGEAGRKLVRSGSSIVVIQRAGIFAYDWSTGLSIRQVDRLQTRACQRAFYIDRAETGHGYTIAGCEQLRLCSRIALRELTTPDAPGSWKKGIPYMGVEIAPKP